MAEVLLLDGRTILKHSTGAYMRKSLLLSATLLSLTAGASLSADSIGIVNFANCAHKSKIGLKEQENAETLRKQLSSSMENIEKDLKEMATKFEDTEYLDSLSPKAEEELKGRFAAKQEELGRCQNQFYQILQGAHQQMIYRIHSNISQAAEKVAQEKDLDYVVNAEACFYVRPDLEVTDLVIGEMDKAFDEEVAKNEAVSTEVSTDVGAG
jgi:outer membrane protein